MKKDKTPQLTPKDAIKKSQAESVIPKAIVVGNLRKDRTSPVGIVIFFGILILVALFLPKISEFFHKEENIGPITSSSEKNPVITPDVDEETEEENIEYFEISDDKTYTINKLNISKIFLQEENNEYFLNFTLTNNTDMSISSNDKYFIELYDYKKTYIERINAGIVSVPSKESKDFSVEISQKAYNDSKLFLMTKKSEKEYPAVKLDYSSGITATMECIKNNDKLTYTFKKDKLIEFKEELSISNENSNYDNLLSEYQSLYEKNVKNDEIEVSFKNNPSSFYFQMNVDLEKEGTSKINYNKLYKKDTSVSTIKFEIESEGYTCDK